MVTSLDKSDKILLIEDDDNDASLVKIMLTQDPRRRHDVRVAENLENGLTSIDSEKPDLIITDLGLPDSQGLETFKKLVQSNPGIPILILSGQDDARMADEALRSGAQDYIPKRDLSAEMLARSVRYAFERNYLIKEVSRFSSTDELTGLCNRRAFMTLARQQIKLSRRNNKVNYVVFADLNDLKRINDTFGHSSGDRALRETAWVLRKSFRDSDILGRIGGDEFAVVAVDCEPAGSALILSRLRANMEIVNVRKELPFRLELSIGITEADPREFLDIQNYLERADHAMYGDKRRAKDSSGLS